MLFNRAGFNSGLFNRTRQEITPTGLSGEASIQFFVSAQGLRTPIPLAGETGMAFDLQGDIIMTVPLTGETGITFGVTSPALHVRLALEGETGITFGLEGQLLSVHTYSITFSGLHLQPGEILIVDMDTLDIFVNGAYNVNVYQSGEFFQLVPGENTIEFYSDVPGGDATVEWESRWY